MSDHPSSYIPNTVFLFLLLIFGLVGCTQTTKPTQTPQPTPFPLEGTGWRLISIQGKSMVEGTQINLFFNNGAISGNAGCNSYRTISLGQEGEISQLKTNPDGTITLPALMITEKDCPTPEGRMEQENAFVRALQSVFFFNLDGGQLILSDGNANILIFEEIQH